MKKGKNVALWIVVSFLVIIAIGSIPSISCVAAITIALLIAPIASWQGLLKKYIRGKSKTIVIIILVILIFITFPNSDMPVDDNTLDNNTSLTEPPTEPPHIHSFNEATCTKPKTCSCGATEGSAKGHSWTEATCTTPKTCSVCNETIGFVSNHNYANGMCAVCGKADPLDPSNIKVWIPTNGGSKYHSKASCSNMKNPEQITLAEARELGYEACARCH